ncbi:MAG: hypothetical protein JST01_02515 [Cyanobacteria bacterium SZAS TMP-1]|nr:hypothetical protein [Cyanobacteria bacterium SZAS TMP-1]
MMNFPRILLVAVSVLILSLATAQGSRAQEAPVDAPPVEASTPFDEKFHAAALREQANHQPITVQGGVRRPLMFFRQIANRKWNAGALFLYLVFISALLKIFLPALTARTIARCRSNCFISLSSAFIYSTILISLVRFAFKTDDLAPMGVFTIGLVQLSFALGACFGVNLLAQKLYEFLSRDREPASIYGRALLYGFCLTLVAGLMAGISLIPNLGRLPRIGNRVVTLVAALGLGGLVNLAAGAQKPRAEAQGSAEN